LYSIERHCSALETLLDYAHAQKLTEQRLKTDEIFAECATSRHTNPRLIGGFEAGMIALGDQLPHGNEALQNLNLNEFIDSSSSSESSMNAAARAVKQYTEREQP
jgi:hypothetical protein